MYVSRYYLLGTTRYYSVLERRHVCNVEKVDNGMFLLKVTIYYLANTFPKW